ncbi:hypothetical protein HJG60_008355 [Phyllostomus discolor]|uniref:Uncharacterized protein n=1 Tax=Phyllostomus discolor TaxID=89673 RepID=A0A833Z9H3_9CHIR|nr:hypothetical protein HJG60_008355 [Phyllostomus discolor]
MRLGAVAGPFQQARPEASVGQGLWPWCGPAGARRAPPPSCLSVSSAQNVTVRESSKQRKPIVPGVLGRENGRPTVVFWGAAQTWRRGLQECGVGCCAGSLRPRACVALRRQPQSQPRSRARGAPGQRALHFCF